MAINITIDEIESVAPDKLRALSNFMLELAGDSVTTVRVGEVSVTTSESHVAKYIEGLRSPTVAHDGLPDPTGHIPAPPSAPERYVDAAMTAAKHEIDEGDFANGVHAASAPHEPTASEVFGAGKPAPSTAAVAPPPTAPVTPIPSAPATIPPAPPTASVAAVPTAPAAPTNPAGVDVDATGLPWDGRIHSRGKSKNDDGRWRMKREIDQSTVASVEAELRAAMGVPVPNVNQAPAVTVTTTPVLPPLVPGAAPSIPVVPSATPSTPPAPNGTPATFAQFMPKVTGGLNSGQFTKADLDAALASVGIQSLPLLASRSDLIPAVNAYLDAVVAAR